MDPQLESGYRLIGEVLGRSIEGQGGGEWAEGGQERIRDLINTHLIPSTSPTTSPLHLPLLHLILYHLIQNTSLSPTTHLSPLLTTCSSNPNPSSTSAFTSTSTTTDTTTETPTQALQLLQESVVDVIVACEEELNDRREEVERLRKERGVEGEKVGGEAEKKGEGEGLSRPLQVLRGLLVSRHRHPNSSLSSWLHPTYLLHPLTLALTHPPHPTAIHLPPPTLTSHLLPTSLLLLPALSLVPASSIPRHPGAERRKRTSTFYKVQRFGVSREASEGYGGLVGLLGDERFLPSSSGTAKAEEAEEEMKIKATALWEECLAFIGWYDLSPTRVLDMILDAAVSRLVTHWRFYLEVLEVGPWGRRNLGPASASVKGKEKAVEGEGEGDGGSAAVWTTEFAEHMKQETGNKILTQIVGIRFMHHRYSERDLKGIEEDPEPASREFLLFTALLIRQGLIRTVDLLPYLSPDEAAMDSLHRTYKLKVQQQIRGLGGNALLSAAALPDDDAPGGAGGAGDDATGEAIKPKKDLPEQKIQLCEALLAIGHLPPAMYMLARWPIIVQCSERVAVLLMRVLRYMLQPAYESISVERGDGLDGQAQVDPPYRSHFAFNDVEAVDTALCPEPIDTERKRFRFFLKEWAARLPRWEKIEEVAEKLQPFLSLLGAMAAADVGLLVWICRIGVKHQQVDTSEETQARWINLIRCCLLPAMPLLTANYGYNNEIWPLLKPLPYRFRYSLYGEWHIAMSETRSPAYVPAMAYAAAATQNTAKQTLKRMTSDLNRAHARAIGKCSYSAPTVLWSTILPQIMSYQNMIATVVETARYLSELGWDVTMFMLLDALSDDSKERVKEDGLTASAWLQAVASLIGTLARKYAAMPLEPLVQQIANQLRNKSLADLITLRFLVTKMSGIDVSQDMSEVQVACLGGGPLMQAEAIDVTRILHPPPPSNDQERLNRGKPKATDKAEKSKARLLQALQKSELALPLVVAIAQARASCIFVARDNLGHTKQLGLAFDDCHNVFFQYLRFLTAGFTTEQYASFIPSLHQLHKDFGLDWATSFHVMRPQLYWRIYHNREAYLKLRLTWKHRNPSAEESKLVTWNEEVLQAPLLPLAVDAARCVGAELHTQKLEPFFVSFWQFSLPELGVPSGAYTAAVERAENMMKTLESWVGSRDTTSEWAAAYRANRNELANRIVALQAEKESQSKIAETALARIQAECKVWFPATDTYAEKRTLATLLHKTCFYPRAIYSVADAVFVPKFARLLHDARVPDFSLLMFYEQFFPHSMTPFLFACSEAEASNLGRAILTILQDVDRWRGSEELYQKEALGADPATDYENLFYGMRLTDGKYLTWGMFLNVYSKWHIRLTKALQVCLTSVDYLHVKNGISIAKALMPAFPKIQESHDDLAQAVEAFRKAELEREDSREDLVRVAQSYENTLAAAVRTKTIVLVPKSEFRGQPAAEVQKKAEAPATAPTEAPKPAESATQGNAMDVDVKVEASSTEAPAQAADIKTLREQLARRKAEGRAKGTPTTDSPPAEVPDEAAPASEMDVDKPADDAAGTGNTTPVPATGKAIPTEPRKREIPTEPRARQASRTNSSASEIPLAPRGPRAALERKATETARSASPAAAPADAKEENNKAAENGTAGTAEAKPQEMQPPAAPRGMRVLPSTTDAPEGSRTPHKRDPSPQRVPPSRSGSVDSKASRASLTTSSRRELPTQPRSSRSEQEKKDPLADNRTPLRESSLRTDRDRDDRSKDKERERAKEEDRESRHSHRDRDDGRDRRRDRDRDAKDDDRDKARTRESDRDRDRERDKEKEKEKEKSERDKEKEDREREKEKERLAEREKAKEKDTQRERDRDRGRTGVDRSNRDDRDPRRPLDQRLEQRDMSFRDDRRREPRDRDRDRQRDRSRESDQPKADRKEDRGSRRDDRAERRDDKAERRDDKAERRDERSERVDARDTPSEKDRRRDKDRHDRDKHKGRDADTTDRDKEREREEQRLAERELKQAAEKQARREQERNHRDGDRDRRDGREAESSRTQEASQTKAEDKANTAAADDKGRRRERDRDGESSKTRPSGTTPMLAERMGLVSRSETQADNGNQRGKEKESDKQTDRRANSHRSNRDDDVSRSNAGRSSPRELLPVASSSSVGRLQRDPPPHTAIDVTEAMKSPTGTSRTNGSRTGKSDLPERPTSAMPKPTLAERMGVAIPMGTSPSKAASSTAAGSLAESIRSETTEKKRTHEDSQAEGSRGSTHPTTGKRVKIDRVGARERGSAAQRTGQSATQRLMGLAKK